MRISPEAMSCLQCFFWPGNIRELKNIIERALIIADTREILPEHLPQEIRITGGIPASPAAHISGIRPLWRVEEEYIEQALLATDNNHSRTAMLLGISRSTLLAKLKKKKESVSKSDMH
jgi:DNA-binding NtrC family response regulator